MTSQKVNMLRTFYKVFVYGTLKKGEPNHYLMTDPKNGYCQLIGKGKTAKKYPLVIASKFNIPFLLSEEGVGHRVRGEIYEVDEAMLKVLDALENHPTYYTRREEPIELVAVEEKAENPKMEFCWVYFLREFRLDLLNRPHLADYSSSGDHNMPYMESDDIARVEDVYDDHF